MLRARRLVFAFSVGLACAGCGGRSAPAHPQVAVTQSQHAPPSRSPRPLGLEDVTAASGVHFQHHTGAFGKKWFPETNGAGVALFDYDSDGYPDLFLVNDRAWNAAERKRAGLGPGVSSAPTPSRLFHNRGDGTFEDVTTAAGVGAPMYGMGCAVGDYDNDGFPDLYVSGVGRGWLFHNEGGKRFREVASELGVAGDGWGSSSAWVDIDRDGRLDLFVGHYVKWDPRTDTPCEGVGNKDVYCGPNLYNPEPCRLYHQGADGHFRDISKQAGIWGSSAHPLRSKAMGVTVCDVDNDGWPDIAVSNDTAANFLFRNNHNGTFTEQGTATGMALPPEGTARSGMGIDAGDWDGSRGESLVIGNFVSEMLSLYVPGDAGLFTDRGTAANVAEPSRPFTTFGCLFADLDNDGWLDIIAANGHIDDKAEKGDPVPLRQRPLFLHNDGGHAFKEAKLYETPLVGRGLATADWDRDGAVDVAITTNGGAPVLLRNTGGSGHSLRLVLEGTKSNRSAIGAVVEAEVGKRVLHRRVKSGSSYLSACELPLTLGLGNATQVDRLTLRWPNGAEEKLPALTAGNEYHIREGSGVTATIPLRVPGH